MKWSGLFCLFVLVVASHADVEAQRPLLQIDQTNVGMGVANIGEQVFAANADGHTPQTRGRWRGRDDRDSDNRDSDNRDSDNDGRRNRRWRGFPFPDRDRDDPRRVPRDRNRGLHNVALENGYSDGFEKGLDDGREQRGFDPSRHRWYRDADRGYDSRYGSRASYTRAYRDGFREGYDDGYRDSRRSGRGRDDRSSIPWPWRF